MVKPSRWLIIELSEHGEAAGYTEVETSLKTILGPDIDYFIPIHREHMGSYVSTCVLFDNYVFVRDCEEVRYRFDEIRECRYFLRILHNSKGSMNTVDSKTVGTLKRKLMGLTRRRFKSGAKVKVLDGVFENMIGEVMGLEESGRKAIVKFKTHSREIIAPMPSTHLVEVGNNENGYY